MRKNKRLQYEIIESDASEREETAGTLPSPDMPSIEPQRDGYAELKAMADKITRARFTVRLDYSKQRMTVGFVLAAVVIVGGLLMCFIHDAVTVLVIGGLLVAAIIAAIVVMCVISAKHKTPRYCYYERNDSGVRCMSVIGERTVLFDGVSAYVFDDGEFMQLDGDAYVTYLDGEGCGLVAVLDAKRDDVEIVDDGVYFVSNRVGGGHTVHTENGKIVSIESAVPTVTDGVDRSGERIVKITVYYKTDMTEDFVWIVPERVQAEMKERGIYYN